MQTTTRLGLKKIELTDAPPDITTLNPNWDTIDQQMAIASDLSGHLSDTMPHRFTDGAKTYRWGLSVVGGVVMFNYEEVV